MVHLPQNGTTGFDPQPTKFKGPLKPMWSCEAPKQGPGSGLAWTAAVRCSASPQMVLCAVGLSERALFGRGDRFLDCQGGRWFFSAFSKVKSKPTTGRQSLNGNLNHLSETRLKNHPTSAGRSWGCSGPQGSVKPEPRKK